MASGNAVWGIEVGQCALKAIKLRPAGDQLELLGFDLIEHPRILSQPDANPDELIKAALEKFVSRNDWQGEPFVIGVPGQQTFSRFCKLPPVDPKKIPDIVRYEAMQQIPFDMDDVVWDYQTFSTPDSPDLEVGIFAMRKDLIRKNIEYYSAVGIAPIAVQTVPSALYNFCRYDKQGAGDEGATVIVDVGAQNTDLIIVEQKSAWSRNIPLGGNSFTEALVKAFKLSFAKAENLKKTAAASKYARQIFQAMRPVFAELVAEIQRSLGFYASTHRDVELKKVLALGNAFRLPGLQKYLENNLTVGDGVVKLEKFNQIVPSANINAPQFAENILSFGAAYGLAIQGLGLAPISASLLPTELARIAVWRKKTPYFAAAAACLGLGMVFPWTRSFLDQGALAADNDPNRMKVSQIIQTARGYQAEFGQAQADTGAQEEKIKKIIAMQTEHKLLLPRIMQVIHSALPNPGEPIASARSGAELKQLIESDRARFARTKRKQFYIENYSVEFIKDVVALEGAASGASDSTFASAGGGGISLSGGGSPRGMGGGGGGDGSNIIETGEGGISENSGFWVVLSGRMLFGEDQSRASSAIEELLANLLAAGQQPDLGFYIPSEDEKNAADRNRNVRRLQLVKYYPQQSNFVAGGASPGTAVVPPEFADPVTGEDMRTDWRFTVAFKIRIGVMPEKPASEPGGGAQPQ